MRTGKLTLCSVVYSIHLAACLFPVMLLEYLGIGLSGITIALLHRKLGRKTSFVLLLLITFDTMFVFNLGYTLSLGESFQPIFSISVDGLQKSNQTTYEIYLQGNITEQEYQNINQRINRSVQMIILFNKMLGDFAPIIFYCLVVFEKGITIISIAHRLKKYVI